MFACIFQLTLGEYLLNLFDLFSQLDLYIAYFLTHIFLIFLDECNNILDTGNTSSGLFLYFLNPVLCLLWVCFINIRSSRTGQNILISLLGNEYALVDVVVHLVAEHFELFLVSLLTYTWWTTCIAVLGVYCGMGFTYVCAVWHVYQAFVLKIIQCWLS